MPKGKMPELIFVAPIGTKHKTKHTRALFIVEEWDENGIPLRMRLCSDDEIINVAKVADQGLEFITGYIQAVNFEPRPAKANRKETPLPREK